MAGRSELGKEGRTQARVPFQSRALLGRSDQLQGSLRQLGLIIKLLREIGKGSRVGRWPRGGLGGAGGAGPALVCKSRPEPLLRAIIKPGHSRSQGLSPRVTKAFH